MPDQSKTLESWVLEDDGMVTFRYADGTKETKPSEDPKWSEAQPGVRVFAKD